MVKTQQDTFPPKFFSKGNTPRPHESPTECRCGVDSRRKACDPLGETYARGSVVEAKGRYAEARYGDGVANASTCKGGGRNMRYERVERNDSPHGLS